MKYIALTSFSGVISMAEGQVREISNESLVKDLIKANLIKEYVPDNADAFREKMDEANKKIEQLELEKTNLLEEIEKLNAIIEEYNKNEDASSNIENETSDADVSPENTDTSKKTTTKKEQK